MPREAFLPGTPLAEAYGSSPVVAHRDGSVSETSHCTWLSVPSSLGGLKRKDRQTGGMMVR